MVKVKKAVNINAFENWLSDEEYDEILKKAMDKIRQLIYVSGVSVPTLADETNIEPYNIYRLLSGNRRITFRQIIIFSRYFKVPIESILSRDSQDEKEFDFYNDFISIIHNWERDEIESGLAILRAYKQITNDGIKDRG